MSLPEMPNWIVEGLPEVIRSVLLLAIGIPGARILAAAAARMLKKRLSGQSLMLVSKAITYSITGIVALMVMRELGFKLTTLLGAAGIAGVAIGFAAQTSLSNLISGAFLIWERAFEVGDVLKIGETVGAVHSIDLLSVKIRKFDNLFVRIPNETLVKTEFTNITRFPIRRLDLNIGVAYKEDIDRVMKVLLDVADKNPYCLDEPEPVLIFQGFGDSALEMLFGVWFEKADFVAVRNSLHKDIKARFDAEGIEIPFPHRTLYTGAVTEPFPIRLVTDTPPTAEG